MLNVITTDGLHEVDADINVVRDKLNKTLSPLVQIGETLIVRVDSILAIKQV